MSLGCDRPEGGPAVGAGRRDQGEQGAVDKVLLITQDVTHLRELEESAAHQKEELEIISRIIRIAAGKFNDFVDSATDYMAENRRLIQTLTRSKPLARSSWT